MPRSERPYPVRVAQRWLLRPTTTSGGNPGQGGDCALAGACTGLVAGKWPQRHLLLARAVARNGGISAHEAPDTTV